MRRLAGIALVLGAIVVPPFSARAQEAANVAIHDNYFSPAEIHVPEGGTVTWTDQGGSHSVTSDDGVSFDSSPNCSSLPLAECMSNGGTFQHQFRTAETLTYHCRVEGSAMVGTVVVDAATTTTTTTTTTSTTSTTTPSSDTSTSTNSDLPPVTQASLPSLPSGSRTALPKSIIRASRADDDVRPLVFVDVAIAATTTVAGIVLIRRHRVPFG